MAADPKEAATSQPLWAVFSDYKHRSRILQTGKGQPALKQKAPQVGASGKGGVFPAPGFPLREAEGWIHGSRVMSAWYIGALARVIGSGSRQGWGHGCLPESSLGPGPETSPC